MIGELVCVRSGWWPAGTVAQRRRRSRLLLCQPVRVPVLTARQALPRPPRWVEGWATASNVVEGACSI
jgi:hypothetical protein